jgi:hypothetical protein
MPVRWTILQALVALAQEIDPEMCRLVAAAGLDLQLLIEGPKWNWLSYLSPTFDSLRSVGLDERLRRLWVELLRRVQSHEWVPILLSDDNQPAVPLNNDEFAALTIDSFDVKRARPDDPEKSDLKLGERYRVRIEQIDPDHDQPGPDLPQYNPRANAPRQKRIRAANAGTPVLKALEDQLGSRYTEAEVVAIAWKEVARDYTVSPSTAYRVRAELLTRARSRPSGSS